MGLRFRAGGESSPQEQEMVVHAGEQSARRVTHEGFSGFIPGRHLGAKTNRK